MVTVDPGVGACGIAYWQNSELFFAEYAKPAGTFDYSPLVIELPQVYQGRKQKGDPNDLIKLAFEAGRIAGTGGVPFETVLPRVWKGQVPKQVMIKRILSKLTMNELKLISNLGLSPSQEHNVIDAVGIGLWKLGRL